MEIKTKFNIGDEVYFSFGIGNERYYAERVKDEICNYTVGWAKYGKIVAIHIKDSKICYEMQGLIACIPESDIISDKKTSGFG